MNFLTALGVQISVAPPPVSSYLTIAANKSVYFSGTVIDRLLETV
jgi:hypothetical protein